VNAKEVEWKAANPGKAVPPAKVDEFRRQIVLEAAGMLEGAPNFDPEVDKFDQDKNVEAVKDLEKSIREELLKKAEQKENLQRLEEATRRSARLANRVPEVIPEVAQQIKKPVEEVEEEEEEKIAPQKQQKKKYFKGERPNTRSGGARK